MWKMRVVILPLVLGTLGSVPFCLENHLKTLSMHYQGLIPKLQKCVSYFKFLPFYTKISNKLVHVWCPHIVQLRVRLRNFSITVSFMTLSSGRRVMRRELRIVIDNTERKCACQSLWCIQMERGQIHAVRMWQLVILTSWIWIFSEYNTAIAMPAY